LPTKRLIGAWASIAGILGGQDGATSPLSMSRGHVVPQPF
jgi:hypothetical protein